MKIRKPNWRDIMGMDQIGLAILTVVSLACVTLGALIPATGPKPFNVWWSLVGGLVGLSVPTVFFGMMCLFTCYFDRQSSLQKLRDKMQAESDEYLKKAVNPMHFLDWSSKQTFAEHARQAYAIMIEFAFDNGSHAEEIETWNRLMDEAIATLNRVEELGHTNGKIYSEALRKSIADEQNRLTKKTSTTFSFCAACKIRH